jgi:hypothetical protein
MVTMTTSTQEETEKIIQFLMIFSSHYMKLVEK